MVALLTGGASGCKKPDRSDLRPAPSAQALTPIEIHVPDRLTGVPTGRLDALGRPERAACVTCHSARKPEALPTSMSELDEFHQGTRFEHGSLSCASCHVIGAQDTLRKADGTTLPMKDAMSLCAQCHGPQFRDYQHHSHGGMNGFWDRKRGVRVRNHCLDCHDPHVPRFQPSTPVLPPHDRGADAQRKAQAAHGHDPDGAQGPQGAHAEREPRNSFAPQVTP